MNRRNRRKSASAVPKTGYFAFIPKNVKFGVVNIGKNEYLLRFQNMNDFENGEISLDFGGFLTKVAHSPVLGISEIYESSLNGNQRIEKMLENKLCPYNAPQCTTTNRNV